MDGVDKRRLLDIVCDYLFYDWVEMPESPPVDEDQYHKMLRSLTGYEFELQALRDEKGDNDSYDVAITLKRSSREHDYFTELRVRLIAILKQDQRFQNIPLDQFLNMDQAQVVFRTNTAQAASGRATMTLRLDGPDGGDLIVPFEFNNIEAADQALVKLMVGD